MNELPRELRYTKTHEWVRLEEDGSVTIGITDHAQGLLGEVVYVELPEIDCTLASGDDCGVIESVKAASDLYAPISGELFEVNEALNDAPETVNSHPYDEGWIMKMHMLEAGEYEELLDAEGYLELIAEED